MSSGKPVTKAVIAAAGFGTRFLPQTKAMPKEMLPIVDKPVIQYLVEDLVAAGIQDIIIVGSSSKRAIEDHFDVPSEDLLNNLRAGGDKKKHLIDEIYRVSELANFIYIRQKGPYGSSTPLANAAHLIGDEPFVYLFADDIVMSEPNTFTQMIEAYNTLGGNILNAMKVTDDGDYDKYGIFGGEELTDGVLKIDKIIEKPGKANAPSDYFHVSSFILEPTVLEYIANAQNNLPEGKEFYLTDYVIAPMIADGHDFYGCIMKNSTRYDTGDKLEYIKTVIDFALRDENIGDDVRKYITTKL